MQKQFTNVELRSFESELLPYLEPRTLHDGTNIKIYNYDTYLKDRKIFVYHSEQKTYAIVDNKITEYQEFHDKLEQLSKLRGRTGFAKKKETEARELQASEELF